MQHLCGIRNGQNRKRVGNQISGRYEYDQGNEIFRPVRLLRLAAYRHLAKASGYPLPPQFSGRAPAGELMIAQEGRRAR